MVSGGLLVGASGKGGGYKLCRKPEEYPVGEILELMEGEFATVACLADGAPPCPRASACETLPMWEEYDKLTHDFFYSRYLSDLLSQQKRT
jgi:DNA-binding IscR family transcriptional regulator